MSALGDFITVSDPSAWRECALEMARDVVPAGERIMASVKGNTVAWRYPVALELVPEGWQSEVLTV